MHGRLPTCPTAVNYCSHILHAEVERNLVANNIQTLDHWKLFNTLFPLTVAKGQQLSQSESLMYRYMYTVLYSSTFVQVQE